MSKSPRRALLEKAKEIASQLSAGRYTFVNRGPVNWASFPFDKHEFAMAIMCDITDIFPKRSGPSVGFRKMDFTMEILSRLEGDIKQLDDGRADVLFDDGVELIQRLLEARDSQNDPIVYGYVENSDSAVDIHDADRGVQGIVFSIQLSY